jgi:hypothetical protein
MAIKSFSFIHLLILQLIKFYQVISNQGTFGP